MDSFKFAIRKQLTSHLCMRAPNKPKTVKGTRRGYGATTHLEGEDEDDEFGFVTLVRRPEISQLPKTLHRQLHRKIVPVTKARLDFCLGHTGVSVAQPWFFQTLNARQSAPETAGACSPQDKRHTLRSFAAYADWAKAVHFSHPMPKVGQLADARAAPHIWHVDGIHSIAAH